MKKGPRKRLFFVLFMALTLIILFSACQEQDQKLVIVPEQEEYQVGISSSAGITLTAQADRSLKNDVLIFHWMTSEGTFLKWQKAGHPRELGQDVRTNEHKMIWAPTDGVPVGEVFVITLQVESSDGGEVLAETSIQIEQRKEDIYRVQ